MKARSEGFRLDPVHLTQEFVSIPSHKSEERLVGYQTELALTQLPNGLRTGRLETGTPGRPTLLIANSEYPRVVIIAHNDTVPPWEHKPDAKFGEGKYKPFSGDIITENGKRMVVGRGALDDKSGAATVLSALAEFDLRGHELPDIMVILTSDEEGHFAGMQAVNQHFEGLRKVVPGYRPEFVLSLNGNGREISTGCRGVTELNLTVHGRTGHAAIRKPGVPRPINAVEEGVELINDLRHKLDALPPTDQGVPTVNNAGGQAGTLSEGGVLIVKPNMVPDTYNTIVEVRPTDGKMHDGNDIDAHSISQNLYLFARRRGIKIEPKIVMDRRAWSSRKEDAAFLEEIIRSVTGEGEIKHWDIGQHGYDEIALFMQGANTRGNDDPIPGAIWGLGDAAGFHAPDEAMGTQEIVDQTHVVRRFIADHRFKTKTFSTPAPVTQR